jgi:hypothetical protein
MLCFFIHSSNMAVIWVTAGLNAHRYSGSAGQEEDDAAILCLIEGKYINVVLDSISKW